MNKLIAVGVFLVIVVAALYYGLDLSDVSLIDGIIEITK